MVSTPTAFPTYPAPNNITASGVPSPARTQLNRLQDPSTEFVPTSTSSTRPQLQLGKMPPPFVPPGSIPVTTAAAAAVVGGGGGAQSQPLNRKTSGNSSVTNGNNYAPSVSTPQLATPPVSAGTPTSKRKREAGEPTTKKVRHFPPSLNILVSRT